MIYGEEKLRDLARSVWQRGGLDTLVKVAPFGTVPDPDRPIGYCTTLKYVVGRTPAEMEPIIGLKGDTKLSAGAEIFAVQPLPGPEDFDLKGYTQCPAGIPTNAPGTVAHPLYPPGQGVPQWDLLRVPQSSLVWLARVPRGQVFRYEARRLPPLP